MLEQSPGADTTPKLTKQLSGASPTNYDTAEVAQALREDLLQLATEAKDNPAISVTSPSPVLLLDDVHNYDKALDDLFTDVLGARGFGSGDGQVPVVLFGREGVANGDVLRTQREGGERGWMSFPTLQHLLDIPPSGDLAYRCWFLFPEHMSDELATTFGTQVFVVQPDGEMAFQTWLSTARLVDRRDVYDKDLFEIGVKVGVQLGWLGTAADADILNAVRIAA